jgi:hypothetical protein
MAASRTIATATPRSRATKSFAPRVTEARGHGELENPAGANRRGFCLDITTSRRESLAYSVVGQIRIQIEAHKLWRMKTTCVI